MNELKITGGARIGRANANFPFATLKVSRNKLELNVSILGNLVFEPSDVISLEPYIQIPVIGQGIKINHTVESYKEKVIFWTFKNPKVILNQIKATGFLSNHSGTSSPQSLKIKERQKSGGYPIRKSVGIAAFLAWNLLFLVDIVPFVKGDMEGLPIGKGVLTALGLLFTSALLSLISSGFRKLILKEGRTLEDIKKLSIFIMIISGFMLFVISINNSI